MDRDGDKTKWGGKGVTKAVANVNDTIAPALIKENLDVKASLQRFVTTNMNTN